MIQPVYPEMTLLAKPGVPGIIIPWHLKHHKLRQRACMLLAGTDKETDATLRGNSSFCENLIFIGPNIQESKQEVTKVVPLPIYNMVEKHGVLPIPLTIRQHLKEIWN